MRATKLSARLSVLITSSNYSSINYVNYYSREATPAGAAAAAVQAPLALAVVLSPPRITPPPRDPLPGTPSEGPRLRDPLQRTSSEGPSPRNPLRRTPSKRAPPKDPLRRFRISKTPSEISKGSSFPGPSKSPPKPPPGTPPETPPPPTIGSPSPPPLPPPAARPAYIAAASRIRPRVSSEPIRREGVHQGPIGHQAGDTAGASCSSRASRCRRDEGFWRGARGGLEGTRRGSWRDPLVSHYFRVNAHARPPVTYGSRA
eukprot:704031-Prorocentrum_minimum.AAC.1